jgi:hypothetical protein
MTAYLIPTIICFRLPKHTLLTRTFQRSSTTTTLEKAVSNSGKEFWHPRKRSRNPNQKGTSSKLECHLMRVFIKIAEERYIEMNSL